MEIRVIKDEERDAASSLVLSVFMEFEAPDYTDEGVETFKRTAVYNSEYMNSLKIYGAFLEGELRGVIATRNDGSHIALFFVDGRYQNQGIGRALFTEVLKFTENHRMTVNSSPYGVPVYHRLGFKDTDTEQTVDGIRFTPMIYEEDI